MRRPPYYFISFWERDARATKDIFCLLLAVVACITTSGSDLEYNLTIAHQLGSPVCVVGATTLKGSSLISEGFRDLMDGKFVDI